MYTTAIKLTSPLIIYQLVFRKKKIVCFSILMSKLGNTKLTRQLTITKTTMSLESYYAMFILHLRPSNCIGQSLEGQPTVFCQRQVDLLTAIMLHVTLELSKPSNTADCCILDLNQINHGILQVSLNSNEFQKIKPPIMNCKKNFNLWACSVEVKLWFTTRIHANQKVSCQKKISKNIIVI